MNMRSFITAGALAGALLIGAGGAAFAQSHQGGYLGLNPGAGVTTAAPVAPAQGSGQGGYLGLNPGANLTGSGAGAASHGSGEGGYLGITPRATL